MSDSRLADAIYPGGPTETSTAPTPEPAAAPTPEPAVEPAAEADTTPTLLTEKEDTAAEPETPAEPPVEAYDAEKLVIPDGMKPDDEILGKFGEIAAKHKMSHPAAQELINLYHFVASSWVKQNLETWQTTQASWVADVKADRELGENLDTIKRSIGKFLDDPAFAGPKTREGFEVTGAGNHPEVIRFISRMAKALEEGTHVSGNGPVRQSQDRSLAQRIYPNLTVTE